MIVLGAGRLPNSVLLVGEAPGKEEAHRGEPFVGASGQEQETYLSRYHLSAKLWYRTNVCKEYTPGNPDPTPDQIKEWEPVLLSELEDCRPKLVVAVGRFAARWFLGDVKMESVHGLPHLSKRTDAVVLPIYHPAFGIHNDDARSLIAEDYRRVAETLNAIESGKPVHFVEDEWLGRETYIDVSGVGLAEYLSDRDWSEIGLDTEGIPSDPWSIQISAERNW